MFYYLEPIENELRDICVYLMYLIHFLVVGRFKKKFVNNTENVESQDWEKNLKLYVKKIKKVMY